jgi:nemo like kinase
MQHNGGSSNFTSSSSLSPPPPQPPARQSSQIQHGKFSSLNHTSQNAVQSSQIHQQQQQQQQSQATPQIDAEETDKVVGYGAFGVVWSVTDPRSGRRVALKKMPNVFQTVVSAKRVFREVKMLCTLKHDNVSLIDEWSFIQCCLINVYLNFLRYFTLLIVCSRR